jgi:hypothetical protein
MKNIRALRQFSHYHAGNFSQFEIREVKDEYAEALVGMELAEYVDEPGAGSSPAPEKTTVKKPGSKK